MFERDLILPESLREEFKQPLGRELEETDSKTVYLTVGDVVSLTFRKRGVRPLLSVYDGRTERNGMTEFADLVSGERRIDVTNPPGTVSAAMADAVRRGIGGETGLIRVEGEEDLAVLPCLIYAPEGAEVVYGMPGRCMMSVVADVDNRSRAKELIGKMEETE